MNRLRVVVADDCRDMREVVECVLHAEFEVVGCAANGKDLLGAALALHPDVIVADVRMPFLTGPQVMNELRSQGIDTPFVFISARFPEFQELIRQGAIGIVAKIDMGTELSRAVRCAASRKPYVSRSAAVSDQGV
jgi:DNA-binding NarL/FixJ family response regulator